MEDVAFWGRCIGQVVRERISLQQAVEVYEEGMPKTHFKQQVSFLKGAI
jgi:salicylate hydroxylase